MNALFLISDEDGGTNHGITDIDLESAMSMKSFSKTEAPFICGLPIGRAFRVVTNAIPRSLLRTVYKRALSIRIYRHRHGNWSLAGYPGDAFWDHDHIGSHHANVAVSHQFISGEATRAELPPFPLCPSYSSVGGVFLLTKALGERSETTCEAANTST